MSARRFVEVAFCALLSACAIGGRGTHGEVATHEFSVAPAAPPALPLRSIDVVGSHWLNTPAMHYRMGAATQRQQFAQNRWLAAPSDMLALRLKLGLPAQPVALTPGNESKQCNLRLELDDLVQVFSDSQHSELQMLARATLFTPQGVLARRNLQLSLPAGGAAAGAAAVSGALVQQLAQELSAWSSPLCR